MDLGPHYFDWPNKVSLENPPSDEWADAVNELSSLKYLLLVGEHVSDDTIGRLSHVPNLLELQVTKTSIGNDGLKRLRQFPRLRWLVIDDAKSAMRADGIGRASTTLKS